MVAYLVPQVGDGQIYSGNRCSIQEIKWRIDKIDKRRIDPYFMINQVYDGWINGEKSGSRWTVNPERDGLCLF